MYALVISALIYLGAFAYPSYLYIGVFLWMLPVLITDKDHDYGFAAGYLWGMIFYSGHLAWFGYAMATRGQGNARIFIYIVIVCYFSLFSGLWLWLKQLLVYRWVRKFKNHNGKWAGLWCTWVISTVTFLYLTCYCSLALFDCFEGYTLINPLLPLVSWTWYLGPICYIGTIGYWIIIVLMNLILASLLIKVDSKSLIFLVLLVCFPAFLEPLLPVMHVHEKEIGYIPSICNTHIDATPSYKFYAISRMIDALALQSPAVRYIVLPEGSFGHDLMVWHEHLSAWTSLLPSTTSIFIGAHRRDGDKMYNSLYQIRDGKIESVYDKEHLVCCTERRPYIARFLPMLATLFAQTCFSYPEDRQQNILFDGFVPMICSELFCQDKSPTTKDVPILFVCNDSWFALPYAQELGKRLVKLYSLRHRVTVVYVGSQGCQIIS